MRKSNTTKTIFDGQLTDKELADMPGVMRNLIPMYEAWKDAGYPSDGSIANRYYAEVIRCISRGVAHRVAGFVDSEEVAYEIKANVILHLKDYVPTERFTPLMFSKNLIANRVREYYRNEKMHASVHYTERRVKIDKMLVAAGYPQGIYTEGLDVAVIRAITQESLITIAKVIALLHTEGYADSLEDYKMRGVKESEYLPDNQIGEDPYTKYEKKIENEILYKAMNKLTKLERFILLSCGQGGATSDRVFKMITASTEYNDDIKVYCERYDRKPTSFASSDVSVIYSFAKDKMRTMIEAAHYREKRDILQMDKADTISIQGSDDDLRDMLGGDDMADFTDFK